MNKEIIDRLPTDEQSIAAKLTSLAENITVPTNFQWELESQLMDAYQNKSQPAKGWFSKIIMPIGWAAIAIAGFFILNWSIRSLSSPEQSSMAASSTEIPFETRVRQGDICKGTIAVGHGFSVSLSNEDKTEFITLNEDNAIGELRSFAWSEDGEQLAILGNTTGSGNIYIAASPDYELLNSITNPDFDYLHDFAWSRDGKQFVTWSARNNRLFLVNVDGSGLVQKPLNVQILGGLQFWPDSSSIVFNGATPTSSGLFELMLADSDAALIKSSIESPGSYTFSHDGSHLAYMEYDRGLGEARLYTEDLITRELTWLGTLAIPKGSGSSVPETTNLSWSQDGTKLIFEFGRNAANRAIYLAYSDGSGIVKVVDSAYAPTISGDGTCLAYISNKQVFIADLSSASVTQTIPMLLADLPTRKGTSDFRLDKLQWSP